MTRLLSTLFSGHRHQLSSATPEMPVSAIDSQAASVRLFS